MKTIRDFDLKGKKVIIRVDFNVPRKKNKILDDTRIKKAKDTILYATKKKAKVILLSHLGRVKEEEDLKKNDLKVVVSTLQKILGKKVLFVSKTRGEEVEEKIASLKEGDILLLQNTRYEDLDGKKESRCDAELSKYWASLGDLFINDAFGTMHRAHASTVGISRYLESGIGFLVEKELTALSSLKCENHPYIIMLGGAKVEDKISLIENLLPKCDKMLIGGGMAFTFLQAEGFDVGNSLVDRASLDYCSKVISKYPDKLVLPVDIICSKEFTDNDFYQEKDINEISFDEMGLDIGSKTVSLFENYLKDASIIFWNGPMGVYEFENYKKGTNQLLTYLVEEKKKTILGGGDIVAAATALKVVDKLYHVSTGGGATLEYLEGKEFPFLKEQEEKDEKK